MRLASTLKASEERLRRNKIIIAAIIGHRDLPRYEELSMVEDPLRFLSHEQGKDLISVVKPRCKPQTSNLAMRVHPHYGPTPTVSDFLHISQTDLTLGEHAFEDIALPGNVDGQWVIKEKTVSADFAAHEDSPFGNEEAAEKERDHSDGERELSPLHDSKDSEGDADAEKKCVHHQPHTVHESRLTSKVHNEILLSHAALSIIAT
jgi:hypothetical protein